MEIKERRDYCKERKEGREGRRGRQEREVF